LESSASSIEKRLKLLNAIELALEGPGVFERSAIHDLHGAVRVHDIARQPDFAITALANAPDQLVIADVGGTLRWSRGSTSFCEGPRVFS
jgi:hypothetical protein